LIKKLKKINSKAFNPEYHVSKRRLIRSLEILLYDSNSSINMNMQNMSSKKTLVIGVKIDRAKNLKLIKERLISRLDDGMIEEVEQLLNNGLKPKRLNYFGLEYKFIGKYLSKEISYKEMVEKLNFAINRFSKRQMTFFRRMEKRGIKIHWLSINNYLDIKTLVNMHFNQ